MKRNQLKAFVIPLISYGNVWIYVFFFNLIRGYDRLSFKYSHFPKESEEMWASLSEQGGHLSADVLPIHLQKVFKTKYLNSCHVLYNFSHIFHVEYAMYD